MESKTWKEIQQKTFTRWVSQRLKGRTVNDLSTDLADGVLLYTLIGELSQKDLGKYNPKPRIQVQKMENLQKVLHFIENEERIRLVNIGAGDIHDGNLKLILGLVWALILHYQISSIDLQEAGNTGNITGKQMLLHYIQDKIPHKNIKNFTTDWSDGTALAALVNAHAPGLCPEADTMDPNNALDNTTLAMNMAEEWLGIPQVLSPDDMISLHVDELSVMTYLSQYPKAVVKPDAPISNRNSETSPLKKIVEQEFQIVDASLVESEIPVPIDGTKVKIYGPGITGNGVEIGKPAMVSIDCTGSGVVPSAVTLQNSDGVTENIEFQQSSLDAEIFESVYVPSKVGKYMVTVKYDCSNLESKSFEVDITDQSQVIVSGSGITGDGANVDKPASIFVDCSKSGIGEVVAIIEASYSKDTKELKFLPQESGSSILESWYIPMKKGLHTVTVLFNGQSISNEPYLVNIVNIDKLKIAGSGVTGRGVRINESAQIILDCSDSGITPIAAKVKYPSGTTQDVSFQLSNDGPDIFEGSYIPTITGVYEVAMEFNVKHIPVNPIKVSINDITKVKISGSGATGEDARVGKPAEVIVDCSDSGVAPVAVKIKSPSGETKDVALEPSEDNPNVFVGHYDPVDAGQYEVAVDFDNKSIPSSPIKVSINDITKVKISGSGVTGEGARVGKPAEVIVDCSDSGIAPVAVKVTHPSGNTEEIPLCPKSNNPKIFEGVYTPKDAGNYETEVRFDDEPLPDSPYKLAIGKPECVRISGDGLDKAFVGEDNIIDVFTDDAGPGDVSVKFKGPPRAGPVVENVVKVDDNHYQVHFNPQDAGVYDFLLCVDNFELLDKHQSIPVIDLDKVSVTGPFIDSIVKTTTQTETFLNIETSASGLSVNDLSITIKDDDNNQVPYEIQELSEGLHKILFTPLSAGNHTFSITFAERQIKDSLYITKIEDSALYSNGRIGEGLFHTIVNCKGEFDVCNVDELSVSITGPGDAVWNIEDVIDGMTRVSYVASLPGSYKITVMSHGTEVIGSPFVVDVVPDSVTKVQKKPVDPQYSIAAPLHIVAMMVMVGVMDHTFL